MKNLFYYVASFIIICMTIGVIFYFFRDEKKVLLIEEEANPVRIDNEIVGLDYVVKIGKDNNESHIQLEPKIFESIYHYLDMKLLDRFVVYLILDNQSKYPYLLKNIKIIDLDSSVAEDIQYKKEDSNRFQFLISRNFLKNYNNNYKIQIELER